MAEPKIVQIAVSTDNTKGNTLYALDESGQIWRMVEDVRVNDPEDWRWSYVIPLDWVPPSWNK